MTHQAKAPSAGSTQATGKSRGLFRRAFATRGARDGSKGSGAPSSHRMRATLAILTFAIALFATAAPALAAPPSTKMDAITDVSYASANVTGRVTADGSNFGITAYAFQYSTDQSNWTTGFSGFVFGGAVTNKTVPDAPAQISVPKGGTKYFVRLVASNGFFIDESPGNFGTSPLPNPSFTTLVADPPVVEATDNATEVEYTTASVSGKVIRPEKSNDLTCNFEYITDAAYLANPVGDRFSGAPAPVPCEPNPVAAEGSSTVKANLTGLANATTYHLRLAVSNASAADAKEAASTFTTQAVTPPSVVSVDNATNVFSRSADAAGVIKRSAIADPAFDIVACRFEYVTAAQFGANGFAGAGSAPCVEPIDNSLDAETSVTANLTGLDAETTYHLRLAAENAAATPGIKEAAATFTTTAKVAKPSVLSIQNATGVDQDSAKVTGEVERPAGVDPALDVTCRAEYVTEASFQGKEEQSLKVLATSGAYTIGFKGQSTPPLAFDAPATSVQAALQGLSTIGAGNVSVRGGPGDVNGAFPYLIAFDGALAGKDVEALTIASSTLTRISPNLPGSATILTAAEGGHSPGFVNPSHTDCDPLAPEGTQEATVNISGLQPDTTYHLRLTAENGGGSDTKDAASTFTTPQNFPASAVVGPPTEVSYGGATLTGETDADGAFSQPVFEVSTDGVNWTHPTPTGGGGGTKLRPVTPVVITGLKGATKYFVRLRVVDCSSFCGATTVTVSQPPYPFFTTLPVDPATVLKANDATDISAETATVSGEIERPANPDPAFDSNCRFEYVTEAQFQANGYQGAGQTPCGIDSLTTPEETKAVEAELTNLKSGTKYHLRLTATNAGPDASLESANTFTTVAVPATATQTAGASDGKAGYVLAGLVNPRNSTISECKFVYGPNSELDYKKYAFAVDCSPLPASVAKPVTVEGHVTGLTPDATYHSRLVVTNAFGTVVTPDQTFVPTLDAGQDCPNEQVRKESNSLTLPECRAYEMVSPPGKEGWRASLGAAGARVLRPYDGGARVHYVSGAGNLFRSGQNAALSNDYVAVRSAAGWETIPDLNGSSGSLYAAPSELYPNQVGVRPLAYSADLLSSLWDVSKLKTDYDVSSRKLYLRNPDGTFTLIGSAKATKSPEIFQANKEYSADLSHIVLSAILFSHGFPNEWGPGVYEYVGTGNPQPRRVDLDNSDSPISSCTGPGNSNARGRSISADGSTIVFHVYGNCGGTSPPADELWARVNGTTSFDVSASRCDRTAADPGGVCNAPVGDGGCSYINNQEVGPGCRFLQFQAATPDGSRVFFTTRQQLLDADTDETNDIYACDIPSGNPAPSADKANHCAAFSQVSAGDPTGADVENFLTISDNGDTVLFTAKGVLADNEDALGNTAVEGDHNLYVSRRDAAHPEGQTKFIARLLNADLRAEVNSISQVPQATPDGRYLVFTTANQLVGTDTDSTRDVYRYDADTGQLTRVSTNVFGVGGNGDGFGAQFAERQGGVSDDGQKIVFTTAEALSPADGNGEPDVYLWTPARVFLIGAGASGYPLKFSDGTVTSPNAAIEGSGQNIYFESAYPFVPADGDDIGDVYTARVGGGFSVPKAAPCSGEACQPSPPASPPTPASPANRPNGEGNVKPKACPKGKVPKKNGKCVKKPKKHSGKKHHPKKHKRAGSNHGGGK